MLVVVTREPAYGGPYVADMHFVKVFSRKYTLDTLFFLLRTSQSLRPA